MAKIMIAPVEEPGTNNHVPGLLTAEDILGADDIEFEYVDMTPYWPGTVKVKGLSGEERNKIGAMMRVDSKRTTEDEALAFFQTRIIAASVINEDGKRLFSQNDVQKLAKKSGAALQRIYDVCARLSGIGQEALEAVKADLKTTPNDDILGD